MDVEIESAAVPRAVGTVFVLCKMHVTEHVASSTSVCTAQTKSK